MAFLGALVVGSLLLSLPVSHAEGARVTVLDAIFTATSAVCVTGLAVVDTGTAFSRFGQTVIMLLIKAGGLGILSLGALLALATGRRLGFRQRLQLQAQASHQQVGGIVRFMRRLLLFTTGVELLGALVLFLRFGGDQGAAEGLFHAAFHSISAFNNAGFALYPDNVISYATDPLVSLTLAALIILGGLGVVVVFEVAGRVRGRTRAGPGGGGPGAAGLGGGRPDGHGGNGARTALSFHSRVALFVTAVLLVGGTLFMLVTEWSNPGTLGPLAPPQKLLAAFFQAVTPRTAGFNSLDFAAMHAGTQLFTMLLMFIGGSAGSTAGGVKTTTFAVLVAAVWAIARGSERPVMFGRRLDAKLVTKAAVVSALAVLSLGAAATLLTFTEPGIDALALMFETVSAFATVGLSLGTTPELSAAGRWIIIALMFLGRVGLVTFALAVAQRHEEPVLRYPRGELIIG